MEYTEIRIMASLLKNTVDRTRKAFIRPGCKILFVVATFLGGTIVFCTISNHLSLSVDRTLLGFSIEISNLSSAFFFLAFVKCFC